MLGTILLVFSFVLFCVAAANINHPRISIGWAGLAFYIASILFGKY